MPTDALYQKRGATSCNDEGYRTGPNDCKKKCNQIDGRATCADAVEHQSTGRRMQANSPLRLQDGKHLGQGTASLAR